MKLLKTFIERCSNKYLDFKQWLTTNRLFAISSLVYFLLVVSASLARLMNLDRAYDFNGDIRSYSSLARIMENGTSIFTSRVIYAEGTWIIPIRLFYYIGSAVTSILLMKLTFLPPVISARLVSFALFPILSSALLVYSLYFLSKKLGLNLRQSAILPLAFLFINDYAPLTLTFYPKGEVFGIALGIIGYAFFVDKKYAHSQLFFIFSVFSHVICIMIPAVLLLCTVTTSLLKRELNVHKLIPLISAGLVLICILSVLSVPIYVEWANEDNVDPTIIYTPKYTSVKNQTPIVNISQGGFVSGRNQAYFLPNDTIGTVALFVYPLTHAFWSAVPRQVFNRIYLALGHNLTTEQINSLTQFSLNSQTLVPAGLILFSGISTTILFLWLFSTVKQLNQRLLCIFAFTLPLFQTLIFALTGQCFFPERSIMYVTLFFSIALASSSKSPKYFLLISIFAILRSALFFTAAIVLRGGY